ncbi:MAG TPA: ATP-dependent DNA helicase [Acidimicrobiia bacterium]|nr:ATP-dependent DNA helicase [Acidimicrobiia bacterium]
MTVHIDLPDRLIERSQMALEHVVDRKPGGRRRGGQEEMVAAIASAIDDGAHVLCEAGPGTGKSFGYLIPALCSGRRVVVSTATKSLQDQLSARDLPFLADVLAEIGIAFRWATVKGRKNYLCRSRLVERLEAEGGSSQQGLFEEEALPETIRLLAEWADLNSTGDRDDLPEQVPEELWSEVSVAGIECPGRDGCPQGESCFAMAALETAQEADVVVVNHHLYGADLIMGGSVLPEHDLVIFDEAHRLEDTMASAFGIDMTEGRFWQFQRSASSYLGGASTPRLLKDLTRRVREVDDALRQTPLGRIPQPSSTPIGTAFSAAAATVGEVLTAIRDTKPSTPGSLGARARVLRLGGHLAGDIAMALSPPEGHVAWVEGEGIRPSLRLAPVEVGPLLAEHLLSVRPVVLTSATLSVGGSLRPVATRLGFEAEGDQPLGYRSVRVGSPFDYDAQACIYVAARLPEPRSPDYQAAALDETEWLVEASGGRALVLTTSYRMLEALAGRLKEKMPFSVLVQGELPKRRLVERFEQDETSVLVATMGFWEGLDIPGRSLELVVIDKLPFPRPDDPLWAARREAAELAGLSAFNAVDLPRAAILLAQGAGRLIRSTEDRGLVALLDSRLMKRRYGRHILRSLPAMPRTTSPEVALAFLRSGGDA